MNTVYILLSGKDHKTYVGSTTDLARRIKEHNSGKCKSTKMRRPFKLIYTEKFDTIAEARAKERYFKTTTGRRYLKKIFENSNL